MSNIVRRERPMFADLMDWFDSEVGSMRNLRPLIPMQSVRVEEYEEEGDFVLRAELPGIDPTRDVELTVQDGLLTIRAERHEEKREGHRTEFHYGSLQRTIALPAGADQDAVRAAYRNGILEVRVPMRSEAKDEARRIEIAAD